MIIEDYPACRKLPGQAGRILLGSGLAIQTPIPARKGQVRNGHCHPDEVIVLI